MKRYRALSVLAIAALVLTTAAVALASELKSPVEILSDVSGNPVEDIQQQRQQGQTYGEMAEDYGKFEEFRQQMIEQKKAILEKRVQEGSLTQEQADEIEKRLGTYCNGEGGKRLFGQGFGAGFGMGYGGCRNGQQRGHGQGRGIGFGR
jgi:phosphate-selective porin